MGIYWTGADVVGDVIDSLRAQLAARERHITLLNERLADVVHANETLRAENARLAAKVARQSRRINSERKARV